jgi:UDPglucose 6-dehydrogenase
VATLDGKVAYRNADFIIVTAPMNYDLHKNFFDTSAVKSVVKSVTELSPKAVIVIKTTVPLRFTASLRECVGNPNIFFLRIFYVSR